MLSPGAKIGIFVLATFGLCFADTDHGRVIGANLGSGTSGPRQAKEAMALIRRLVHDQAGHFNVVVDKRLAYDDDGKDVARVESVDKTTGERIVAIRASSGVAAALAFNYYIKYKLNGHVSFDHVQIRFPRDGKLPPINVTLRAQDRIRFYQNVCTYGYSFVWWDWPRWERHLDWMALSGINLAYAFEGQESAWLKTFQAFGMTEKDVLSYFSGPAFLPWNRMGNLFGWAGPLTPSWIQQKKALQRRILRRMASLGITAVLPAFNGIVPEKMTSLFPEVNVTRLRKWGHFTSKYSSSFLLDFDSSLFRNISRMFLTVYREHYSDASRFHFYGVDTFNEMSPPFEEERIIRSYAKSMPSALKTFDESAVWVLQGWMFLDDTFWSVNKTKEFLAGIPKGSLLVLDLASTTAPQYKRLDSYFGHPFVYCLLENYGGTYGFYGKLSTVNLEPYLVRRNASVTMVGLGITPEGIFSNYVMYELMLETPWRTVPIQNLDFWFNQYHRRRAAGIGHVIRAEAASAAWKQLEESALDCRRDEFRFHGRSTLTSLPSLKTRTLWYDPGAVLQSWDLFIESIRDVRNSSLDCSNAFIYDVVDVTRQALTNGLADLHVGVVRDYKRGDTGKLRVSAYEFTELVSDLDTLLGSCRGFLLGKWIRDARQAANNTYEAMLFEFNARNQITLWGPKGNILDYAAKEWAGLIRGYYLPRWKLFFHMLLEPGPWDQAKFKATALETVGIPFTLARDRYPDQPQGKVIDLLRFMHAKWRNKISARA